MSCLSLKKKHSVTILTSKGSLNSDICNIDVQNIS